MRKVLKILLLMIMVISCDRPASHLNPFDPESDLAPNSWMPKNFTATVVSD